MHPLNTSLLIFLGAGLGANARYWVGALVADRLGVVFPAATLVVNLSGSMVIGLFMGLAMQGNWSPTARIFVIIGILGGYTTFSTFSWETLHLIRERALFLAMGNVAASVLLGLIGCYLGLVAAQLLAGG
jgi:fluoride exporter